MKMKSWKGWTGALALGWMVGCGAPQKEAVEAPAAAAPAATEAPAPATEKPKAVEVAKAAEPTKAPVLAKPAQVDLSGAKAEGDNLAGFEDGRIYFYSNGKALLSVVVPATGEYEVNVMASSQPAKDEHAAFRLWVGEKTVGEVTLTSESATAYRFKAKLAAGKNAMAIEFTNDLYDADAGLDRNLYVESVMLKQLN